MSTREPSVFPAEDIVMGCWDERGFVKGKYAMDGGCWESRVVNGLFDSRSAH